MNTPDSISTHRDLPPTPEGLTAPTGLILTAEEAVQFLRLDIDRHGRRRAMGDAVRSLEYLVQRGRIRPVRIGKCNRFNRADLEFLADPNAGFRKLVQTNVGSMSHSGRR